MFVKQIRSVQSYLTCTRISPSILFIIILMVIICRKILK